MQVDDQHIKRQPSHKPRTCKLKTAFYTTQEIKRKFTPPTPVPRVLELLNVSHSTSSLSGLQSLPSSCNIVKITSLKHKPELTTALIKASEVFDGFQAWPETCQLCSSLGV